MEGEGGGGRGEGEKKREERANRLKVQKLQAASISTDKASPASNKQD